MNTRRKSPQQEYPPSGESSPSAQQQPTMQVVGDHTVPEESGILTTQEIDSVVQEIPGALREIREQIPLPDMDPALPNDVAIGEMLELASQKSEVKKVLYKYRAETSHQENCKKLTSFGIPFLEKTATFLKLAVRNSETDEKLYQNKNILVDRVILKIESYLETSCDECDTKYRNKITDEEEPKFSCHFCMQGSHNCDFINQKYEKYQEFLRQNGKPVGLTWLCHGCHKANSAQFPPKTGGDGPGNTETRDKENSAGPSSRDTQQQRYSAEILSSRDTQTTESHRQDVVTTGDLHSRKQICPKFVQMKCPHGLRGKRVINGRPCPFYHPRICQKWCSFGPRGCNRDGRCKKYHPTICRDSRRNFVCNNINCTYTHLKYTVRPWKHQNVNIREPEAGGRNSPRAENGQSRNYRPTWNSGSNTNPISESRASGQEYSPEDSSAVNNGNVAQINFLEKLPEILSAMQEQQKQFQNTLQEMRTTAQGQWSLQQYQEPPQWIPQNSIQLQNSNLQPVYPNLQQLSNGAAMQFPPYTQTS